jgi:hypothetical protein
VADKEVRDCKRHGPVVHYYLIEKKTGQGRWRCRRCTGEAVLKRKHKIRRILIVEAGACCQSCGYDRCWFNLHFHHVDPSKKKFALTRGNGKSLARFREEARKCVLVCANCHGEIEAGMRPCPPTMVERMRFLELPVVTPEQLAREARSVTPS